MSIIPYLRYNFILMADIEEQILAIEKEIRETPYHKATEHYIGKLRAKLAKLRNRQQSTKKSGGGKGYTVKKQGDATVVLVGPPSVGKSTLLNKLTNAKSKIAPYAFTTVSVIPGMLEYRDAKIQILDVPGLIEGAEKGKGRGREVLSVARAADLIIIITEIDKTEEIEKIKKALQRNGIEINKKPDPLFPNKVYVPALSVINKLDLAKSFKQDTKILYISAEKNLGLEELQKRAWKKLKLVCLYLVKRNEKPNLNSPIIMKKNQTLTDIARKIGEEFAEEKKGAVIWGTGAKFPGQEVSLSTKVKDGMQIRFI